MKSSMKPVARLHPATAIVAALAACSGSPPSGDSRTLAFAVDTAVGTESYECFGFDAQALAGRYVRSIAWTAPLDAEIVVHHAALYASPDDYPAGPVACDSMPASWTMHVWAPGQAPLTLPADVGVAMPAATRRIIVQAHVIRAAAGPPEPGSVTIGATETAPPHVAAWLVALGSVPAIRPQSEAQTSTTCIAAAPMHIVDAWPHMHLIGKSIQASIVHPDGSQTVFVDVPQWDFHRQQTYPVDQDVAQGEGLQTDCAWVNTSDAYVLPGFSTENEMCGVGLIVWPGASAGWQSCQ